jgi:cyanophycin synthetase
MEIRKVRVLRGPNIWASFPVLEAWVDLGALKDSSSEEVPGFNDRLMSWLPTLIEHRCSVGERGGFFQRLVRGTYLAHILEHVTLELQTLAGTEVGFGRTRMTAEEGVYKVAVEYEEEELGQTCLEAARELCLAALDNRPYDVQAEIARLREVARRVAVPPGVGSLLAAARSRKIPVRHLGEGLYQLGLGARQRRLLGTLTDSTGALAESIAGDLELTRTLLRAAGVPVPDGRPVADADDAWAAAEEIGIPVTLRPRYQGGERGVIPNLTTREQVLAAYAAARAESSHLLIERVVPGAEWRLLVVGAKVVAAVRHEGSSVVAVTDVLHPEVAARAVVASRVVGLDVAGIAVTAADIRRPLEEQGGRVAGVDARPDLGLFLKPVANESCPVGEAIVAHLFPDGQTGRIPVVGITGVNGKTTTTRLIAHLLAQTERVVGMTCTEGIYVGSRRIATGDCSGPKSARLVLQNPQVEAAVLETARGGILREGLGFDRCDVAVVTNIGEGDHLDTDIDTPEQLAWVKRTLVDAVSPTGAAVLNAEDPLVQGMAPHCPGAVILFARDGEHPGIVRHRSDSGRVAFVRAGVVLLADGEQEVAVLPLNRVPLTHGGRVGFQVENVLAATAAAWALDTPLDAIRSGLESFAGMEMVPGRFNLLDVRGVSVIVDYGHNTSALASMFETLGQFPHERRAIVYSAAGDRRDGDIVRQGQMLGDVYNRVILYEDSYMRGRKDGEITALFRQGLTAGQRVQEVLEVRGGLKAVEAAFATAQPGELLVIQPNMIDETVEYLHRQRDAGVPCREVDLDEILTGRRPEAVRDGQVEYGNGIVVRDNRLGKHVYTLRPIAKGEVVLRGWGVRWPERTRHTIQIDHDTHIVAEPPILLLNHSCEPTCGILVRRGVEQLEICALRHIEAGEEITLDYATFEYEVEFMTGPCLCQTPSCRGFITGYKDLPESLRKAYGPYIAEYLREAKTLAYEGA